jgi:3-oxoacyl-[acyl-carrier protein] reductase
MTGPAPTLAGKTALVTGAATGIGKAIAAALAAAGARVVINHPHTPELAEKVIAGIEAAGGTALAIAADISRRDEYQAMVSRMLAEYGRWDVLVNNAAVAITKPFAQVTEAEFDLSFAVNVKGVFHGLQLAWDHLADDGRIITISSSTTALMLPGYAVYDATKGAAEQLTRILSREFGPRRITINASANRQVRYAGDPGGHGVRADGGVRGRRGRPAGAAGARRPAAGGSGGAAGAWRW